MITLSLIAVGYLVASASSAIVIPGALYFTRRLVRDHVSTISHVRASQLITHIDEAEHTPEEVVVIENDNRQVRVRKLAAAVGSECRTHYGFRERSEANELVARKYMRDRLKSIKDMRHADINLVIPAALSVCFIPSRAEVDAAEVYATSEVQGRIARGNAKFWDVSWWWGRRYNTVPTSLSG